ncbi:hypothetical protein [Polaribacter sp.]|uniref:hypothetical protein n=1 Tax=Polaribacter sp. TaxID=1920175 RepID=UPI0040478BCC
MLNKYLVFISFILSICLYTSCKSNKIDTTDKKEIVVQNNTIRKEIPSPDKSKILVLEYLDKLEIPISFNYKVIDSKSKKELISGVFSGVKMEWETNTTIKAFTYLGIVEMDNENPEKLYKIIKVE